MSAVQLIEISKIRVINPRARNRTKFAEIVTSISRVGLKRPVTVCPREGKPGEYDLACGQGRLEAYVELGETHIPAMVRKASSEDRYVMSLVENIARRPTDSMDLIRGIAGLEKRGYGPNQIAEKLGLSDTYVRDLLRLHADGEEKLLVAVERGDLPLTVAIAISAAKDADVKRCLAQAFESGELEGRAVARARRVVEQRLQTGKRRSTGGQPRRKMTPDDLVKTYKRSVQRQTQLVKRAKLCDEMLRLVCSALRDLMKDEHFVTLLRAEKLDKMPKFLAEQLKGRAP